MKLALSTNWCNRELDDGEAIAERALSLGFDELELGFHTSVAQVAGFKRMRARIPVGSIHAFCPVPVSAPQGHPELYALASFDEDQRALAAFHVRKNIEFAAEIGAETVVLHAGRVAFGTLFNRGFDSGTLRAALADDKANGAKGARYQKLLARARKTRTARGARLMPLFVAQLEALVPVLERHRVTLALENLPYLEGFPDEAELAALVAHFRDAPIRGWFDTGHDRVRASFDWLSPARPAGGPSEEIFRGMHLNDVVDFDDDHLAPGDGKVDFAALATFARRVRHIVFEPKSHVDEAHLRRGVELIRRLFT